MGPGFVVLSVWLMGYPSPAVDARTGAGDPVLNVDVVLAPTAMVAATTCVVNYCNIDITWSDVASLTSGRTLAGVIVTKDDVDAMETDISALNPATRVLYFSAHSFTVD